ncbi:MAG: response regulator [Anaerolineae bacterium]|nr:response regulator [Anaerolineae bacterium]
MSGYILIVDDHLEVRELIADVLHTLGLEGKSAVNGRDALEMIAAEPPRLIILDIMMPVMDGFSVLTRLQQDPVARSIPIIILSAIADEAGPMTRLAGVGAVLRKGRFNISELRRHITRLLSEPVE